MKKILIIVLLVGVSSCIADMWTRYAMFPDSNTHLKTTYRSGQTIHANEANRLNSEVNSISRYLLEGWLGTNLLDRLVGIEATQGVFQVRLDYGSYTQALQQAQINALSGEVSGLLLNPMQDDLDLNMFSILNVSNIYFSASLSDDIMPQTYIDDTEIGVLIKNGYQTNIYGDPGYGIKYNNDQNFFMDDNYITLGNFNNGFVVDKGHNQIIFSGEWSINVDSNQISNVADPIQDLDVVNLRTLMRAIAENALYLDLLNISNFDFEQYIIHHSESYYGIMDIIMANPVLNSNASIAVSGLPLSTFLVENYVNDILLSFDDKVPSADYDLSICGILAAKTHLINTEYQGTTGIEAGTNEISIILTENFIDADSVVLITPYKTDEILYNYWYEYVDTNEFKIKTNVIPNSKLEFKWLLPSVINSLISTPNFVFGSGASEATISAGDISSDVIQQVGGLNHWGSYTNAICLFVPTTSTPNLFSWYQQRDMESDIGIIKVILDDVQDRDLKFKFAILIKE